MRIVLLQIFLFQTILFAQSINYSPNRKLEKVVDKSYYDAEFIYLTNQSDHSIDLQYEIVENTFLPEWSAAFCTNTKCFNDIPVSGDLGTLPPSNQAYFQFNFGANETVGEGLVKIHLSSSLDSTVNDTVTFKYTVTEDGTVSAQPWVKLKYNEGVVTIFLENPSLKTKVVIANLNGQLIHTEDLGQITSVVLREQSEAVYFCRIEDETGRFIEQKIPHFW